MASGLSRFVVHIPLKRSIAFSHYQRSIENTKSRCHTCLLYAFIITTMVLAGALCAIQPDNAGKTAGLVQVNRFGDYSCSTNTIAYPDKQWALSTMSIPDAWQITSGDSAIVVAVLDTGIDKKHSDLHNQIIGEGNFTPTRTTDDIYGHGTHIAGLIAALNNDKGITGIANRCHLLNAKVADDRGLCFNSDIAKGIIWAADEGADVINMSLYTFSYSAEVEKAIDYAWNKGAIVICAAGNGTGIKKVYPAVYDNCLAVAASNRNDCLESWSGHGDWVDIAAPGVDIYSTIPYNRYENKTGTSMAAAYVSGIAALLYSVAEDTNNNGFVNDEVLAALLNGSEEIESIVPAIKRINAYNSLAALLRSSGDSL